MRHVAGGVFARHRGLNGPELAVLTGNWQYIRCAHMNWFSLRVICLITVLSGLASAGQSPTLSWTNNLLTISGPELPGGKLDVWYLEAFCRKGSTDRDWSKTVVPHKTQLLTAQPRRLAFRTMVETNVEVLHEVTAGKDEIDLRFELHNRGTAPVDLEWFQPACIRVAGFTGLDQTNYTRRSFIFTSRGLTTLDETHRREEALYRGGQVYVPGAIDLKDVNPRPIAGDQPTNGLIGCFSTDGKQLLATASDNTQELFEGVYVCLHSDPRIGGLNPGETKHVHAKIYLLPNDPVLLLKRYEADFKTARPFQGSSR
jgi:hypothetical protein